MTPVPDDLTARVDDLHRELMELSSVVLRLLQTGILRYDELFDVSFERLASAEARLDELGSPSITSNADITARDRWDQIEGARYGAQSIRDGTFLTLVRLPFMLQSTVGFIADLKQQGWLESAVNSIPNDNERAEIEAALQKLQPRIDAIIEEKRAALMSRLAEWERQHR